MARRPVRLWSEQYADSPLCREYVRERALRRPWGTEVLEPRQTPVLLGLRQWWTLVQRSLAIKAKNRWNTLVLLAQAPVIGTLITLVYGQQLSEPITNDNWHAVGTSLAVTLFLTALAALWFGASNSVREIVGEWAIYRRERMVNLRLFPYVLSKFTVLGGFCFIQCALLLWIVHRGCSLEAPWWSLFTYLYLSSLIGVALGLTLSALAKTAEVAISLLPMVLLPMVILGGIMHPVHKMGSEVRTMTHFIGSRWAFEGTLLLENERRPTYTPPELPRVPTLSLPGQTAPKVEEERKPPPAPQDMAEVYFPRDGHRGTEFGCKGALGFLLAGLFAAIHLILRFRDVH